jgi:probable blue pigment (indigoidine) exporter
MTAVRPSPLPVALFAAMVGVWGINYLVVREGLTVSPPLWLAAARSGTGAAGVAAYALATRNLGALTSSERWTAFLVGIPNTGLFFGLWFVAAESIPPGETAVLIYTFPLWVAILSTMGGFERLTHGSIFAIAAGFTGVVLISQPWVGGTHPPSAAVAEALAGAVCWAGGTILFKRLFRGPQISEANLWQLLGGTVGLVVAALSVERTPPVPSPLFGLSVLWLGLIGTAFAYLVWFWLLDQTRASSLSSYVFLVPVVALVLSVALGLEGIDAVELLGVALVLGSLYVPLRASTRAPDARRGRRGPFGRV